MKRTTKVLSKSQRPGHQQKPCTWAMCSLSEAQLYLQQQRPASASTGCEAPLLACAKTAVEAAFVMQINSTFLPSIKHLNYRS